MGCLGKRLDPNVKKETPNYSEELIQKVLRYGSALSQSSLKYRAENLSVFSWESDSLEITKSGYSYEYEIKISKADFKNDFKHKKMKHQMLEGTYQLFGDEWLGDGKMTLNDKPNYFYYVVPENLISVEEIPEYAGLIYVHPLYNSKGEAYHYRTEIVKVAPKLHKEKIDEGHLRLTEKFYYNYINWKHKYQDDIDSYKQMINEAKTFDGTKYRYTLPEAIKVIDNFAQEVYDKDNKIKILNEDLSYERSLRRRLMRLLEENNIDYKGVFNEDN